MADQIVLYPILIQLLLSILLMFCWKKVRWQKAISMAGSAFNLGISAWLFWVIWTGGIQTVQAGNWPAPFGITFVADTLAATLVLLTAVSGLAVSVYATATIVFHRLQFGFLPIFHFLLLGLNGAFLTGDIFNLYVWFEIIIISSFVLLTIGGEKLQLGAAVKYFTLNILASVIFLTAIAALYGLAGTLNMADLSLKVAEIENRGLVEVTAILFLIGFGIKAAIFPLYFWLPSSYHTPPAAVSAIFGGLLTKVGVYALIRVFTLIFSGNFFLENVLLFIAGMTLVSGALGALVQNNIFKVFSYLIICHIGYMVLGLGLFTEAALTGAVFYLIHDIIVKTNLFISGGMMYKMTGTKSLRHMGGLYAKYPAISLLLAIPLFSLAGIPPLSGFWPKLALISESFSLKSYWPAAALLFASFVTLFVIARIWSEAFWKNPLEILKPKKLKYFHHLNRAEKVQRLLPIGFLAAVSLYIGLGAEHIQRLSIRIAGELMDTQPYIHAVLNIQP